MKGLWRSRAGLRTVACLLALTIWCGTGAARGSGTGRARRSRAARARHTYLPWTVGTKQPVRFAPALAVNVRVTSRTKNPGAVAQRFYDEWVKAGVWNWVNKARRHWLMLYCPLYNWQAFYADEHARPKDPANPGDPGYSWRMMDELLNMDAVRKDGARWLVRINWQSWGKGTPQWLMQGQGAVNNEDNGLGGGMLFPGSKTEGLPAFQRVYVQKEFRYFAEAFGKRYRDRAELGGIIFDEIQVGTERIVRSADFDRNAYFRAHDDAMLYFAEQMPNTAIVIYQVWAQSRKDQLTKAVNIGFGCADARLWVTKLAQKGPWHPDAPPAATGNGYYTSAQVYNYAARRPRGGSRHFWLCGSEENGWKQVAPIPEACGGANNILGCAAGTRKNWNEIAPDYFIQYHACAPRNPGGCPGLNGVPGIVHAAWLILDDRTKSWRRGSGEMPRSKGAWADALRRLGPQGLDCIPEEPYGWEKQLRR